MHPAWRIDEVRLLIFELLDPGDLARLARTNKEVFEFTTDHLWKQLTSFKPFIHCLPKHIATRKLELEELSRLDLYARKVKVIVLEGKTIKDVIRLPAPFFPPGKKSASRLSWNEVWTNIAELRPNSEFLPNLCRLRVSNIVEELLLPLVGISGSHLTYLYIKYIQDSQQESVRQKFLDHLQNTSKLEYLFVRDGEQDLLPIRMIEESPLKHLRLDPRVSYTHKNPKIYKQFPLRTAILRKSTLELLTLGLTREWYSQDVQAAGKYLPSLKSLWLNLRTFGPEPCDPRCVNIRAHSWTCKNHPYGNRSLEDSAAASYDCGRKPPTLFFEGLNAPELDFLEVKFRHDVTGPMFLELVRSIKTECRLENLSTLALVGGGYFSSLGWYPYDQLNDAPKVTPQHLRDGLGALLPLPRLKVLRYTVAPNFLDILDLDFYRSIADNFPGLESLQLGHKEFYVHSEYSAPTLYERVPLHHLAAFCCMFPDLTSVEVGCVDGLALEETPDPLWSCPHVLKLSIHHWARHDHQGRYVEMSRERLLSALETYFPNSDLARHNSKAQEHMVLHTMIR